MQFWKKNLKYQREFEKNILILKEKKREILWKFFEVL